MITYKEFEIIRVLLQNNKLLTNIVEHIMEHARRKVFKSVDEITDMVEGLERKNCIKNGEITDVAMREIESLKVSNAVILAAGGSEVSSKSVYSKPKGLFKINGETLIERQIRQLKEAGIDSISVVVGYKQELYYFLMDKWGVDLMINPDIKKNNIYSLYLAKDILGNTYVCNCDNYFAENPFSQYEYNSYHATVYKANVNNELLVRKNKDGRILEVFSGKEDGECIFGQAYLDKTFSMRLVEFLNNEIDNFRISAMFWEEYISRHIDDFDMYALEYEENFIREFDSIREMQDVDGLFLSNVSDTINDKICDVFNCGRKDIKNIMLLKKGLTNILFTFEVKGETFVFRYPGGSSSFFVYRENECEAQKIASKAHADETLVYIDVTGIKISRYRKDCINISDLYYKDVEFMKAIARKIRLFHDEGYRQTGLEKYAYDPVFECERLFKEASLIRGDLFKIFKKEWKDIRTLKKYADMDNVKHTMCHNDINIDNILKLRTLISAYAP